MPQRKLREISVEEADSMMEKLRTQERIEQREREMDEAEEKIRNPDGSLNTTAIYRKWRSAGRKRA